MLVNASPIVAPLFSITTDPLKQFLALH
jgi:hypothetical protein